MSVEITTPLYSVDASRMRQVLTNLLTFASIRLDNGSLTLAAKDD